MSEHDDILARLDRIIELLTPEPQPPRATVELQPGCEAVAESLCALRSEDARISRASFADPLAWSCKGCRIHYKSV
jgi:hypothetical protein